MQPIYSRWLNQSPPIETTILAGLGQVELHLVTQSRRRGQRRRRRWIGAVSDSIAGAGSGSGQHRWRARSKPWSATLLRARGWWVAFAESCTGGLATSRLTDIPGSSDYVERSVVAYSNRAKIELLDVPEALIARARRRERAGGAGDGGGHPQARRRRCRRRHHRHRRARRRQRAEARRHGLHCAWTARRRRRVRTFRFPGGREMVKAMSANWAIDMLRRIAASKRVDEGVRRGRRRRRRSPRSRRASSPR